MHPGNQLHDVIALAAMFTAIFIFTLIHYHKQTQRKD